MNKTPLFRKSDIIIILVCLLTALVFFLPTLFSSDRNLTAVIVADGETVKEISLTDNTDEMFEFDGVIIKAQGRNAIMVSLDDFYKEQSEAPKFEDGSPDFETVHALNVPQIVDCLHRLIDTGECSMPVFDFITKSPKQNAKHLKIGADDVVIVEGLHALNPLITEPLSDEDMLKLYVSVSSRIYNSEDKVEFTKRDIRFIRRMIRDYHFRGSSVEFTFYLWKGVRRGEDEYLFPFTENADIKIDSIHPYELCVYKEQAIKLLGHIEKDSEYYETARNYIERLSGMLNLSESYVPDTSLLHEFIG